MLPVAASVSSPVAARESDYARAGAVDDHPVAVGIGGRQRQGDITALEAHGIVATGASESEVAGFTGCPEAEATGRRVERERVGERPVDGVPGHDVAVLIDRSQCRCAPSVNNRE